MRERNDAGEWIVLPGVVTRRTWETVESTYRTSNGTLKTYSVMGGGNLHFLTLTFQRLPHYWYEQLVNFWVMNKGGMGSAPKLLDVYWTDPDKYLNWKGNFNFEGPKIDAVQEWGRGMQFIGWTGSCRMVPVYTRDGA